MANARQEPSDQPREVHLVPEKRVTPEIARDPFRRSRRAHQQKCAIVPDALSAAFTSTEIREGAHSTRLSPTTVLRELFELLEDYAPAWYTEEMHHRAMAALKRRMG